jgi:hypothetical protein
VCKYKERLIFFTGLMKYDLPNKSIHKFYGFLCLDEMQKTVKYSWRKCEWKGDGSRATINISNS